MTQGTSFDSLPLEIKKVILCYLEYDELCLLKRVSSYWKGLIEEVLRIETIAVTDARSEDATNIFCQWSDRCRRFHVYRTQYVINSIYINRQTNNTISGLLEVEYTDILRALESHATHGGVYSNECKDPVEATWRTVLAMTEISYSLDELRNKDFKDEYVKSFMEKYKWYVYSSRTMFDISWDVGFIAIYPNLKTFSVVHVTDVA